MKKVGINGFGRIGRMVFRAWIAGDHPELEIVAVNNPLKKGQTVEHFLHMLEYDSVHGRLKADLKATPEGFEINGKKVKFFTEMDPSNIDWTASGAEYVVDSTGIFKDKPGLGKHLKGSVKKSYHVRPGRGTRRNLRCGC